jgi:hypothetical protein
MEMKFELGQEVKEIVTGFKGIVMGRTEYITGCKQYGILPRKMTDKGNVPDWTWLDEDRLVWTGKTMDIKNSVGGPQQHPNKI